ncbi:MAG: hypothetical protein HWN80_18055 [Candidatus Lokiarchaeota archaeon]|nr:hypothetical protein [Candidatus Lokiarchaeota archaeon]
MLNLTDDEIKHIYEEIQVLHKKYLNSFGVRLPRLKTGTKFTKNALVLVYLYKKINQKISKTELTSFMKIYYPDTNEVQQARHLAAQGGWYILSGTRGDIEVKKLGIKNGEYQLISLKEHYPKFTHMRRESNVSEDEWEQLKKHYDHRCATCGSKEGELNIHYPSSTTKLQKGHMNPNKPLTINNMIPQCEKCNRPDRNYFEYDKKGRVVRIADPRFILKSDKKIQKKVFEFLKLKFDKENKSLDKY